jgi:NADPH-dependent 2,4-dienoyl-CoA reductase/sulfur reductase-like enzyme
MARLGHQVTIVDTEARPLHRLHDPLPALAESALRALGVSFRGEVRIVQAVKPADGGRTRLELELDDALEADIVVAATGGRQTQLELTPAFTLPISVDARMQVPGLDGVYAIGDCASPHHLRFGEMRFPHWDAAHGMAERAADAIAGVDGAYQRLPYWWSDIGDLRVAEVGYAAAVAEWEEADGLTVGRDEQGEVAAVLVVGSMSRLREARELMEQRENVPEPKAATSAVSFDRDIRRLFREDDRRAMEYAFDLWLYEDVRDWAPRILERMEDGTMPCDQEWPPEHLERFRSWIEAGCAP